MKYKRLILLLSIAGLFITPFCEPDKKMAVETNDASNISTTTADVSGTVIDVGEGATQHGHCYGTASGPVVSGNKTSLGVAVTGDFTSNLTGLQPSTKYYVRAYTSLGGEAAYGSEITFTTESAELPEVTTAALTSITKTSAVSGGTITSEGGTPVTERGVCWNVATGPTIAESKTTNGSGSGTFASSITGLTANTKYYVRAYATNAGGTAYGNEISFTTSPEVAVAPTVTTAEVTSVTSTSAVSGGDVTNEGGAPVTAKGVCWSTTANPTITSSKTTDGTGTGSFVSNLTNLVPGTTYYIRSYATNSAGTSYGYEFSFATSAVIPNLTTITVTAITVTTATSGGNITSDGGSAVTLRGVCWSTSAGPTTDDSKTTDGFSSGLYSSNLTGLTGNTTYYVRAYATNSAGTAYGNELSFKTSPVVPVLTTTEVTSVTATTASSGGNITSDGGSTITARGVCWSTAANPTTADSKTSDGTGTVSFTSSITGLTPRGTYYVRAYAINIAGTGYGNEVTFTTSTVPGAPIIGTATAGNAQATVTFTPPASDGGSAITGYTVISNPGSITGTGTASPVTVTGLTNLTAYTFTVVATNVNGNSDPSAASNSVIPGTVTSANGRIWMDRNLGAIQVATSSTDANSYGHLYQWGRGTDGHQVRTSGTTSTLSSSDSPGHGKFITVSASPYDWRSPQNDNLWQGVSGTNNPCPGGYRLPTGAEWDEERLSWSSNNAAGAFASPLRLPVAGGRDGINGSLDGVGSNGYYWSSTVSSTNSRYLYFNSSNAYMSNYYRVDGYSVRCIKDY